MYVPEVGVGMYSVNQLRFFSLGTADLGLTQVQRATLTNVSTEHGPNDISVWQFLYARFQLPIDLGSEITILRSLANPQAQVTHLNASAVQVAQAYGPNTLNINRTMVAPPEGQLFAAVCNNETHPGRTLSYSESLVNRDYITYWLAASQADMLQCLEEVDEMWRRNRTLYNVR